MIFKETFVPSEEKKREKTNTYNSSPTMQPKSNVLTDKTVRVDLTPEQIQTIRVALAIAVRDARMEQDAGKTVSDQYLMDDLIKRYKDVGLVLYEAMADRLRDMGVDV